AFHPVDLDFVAPIGHGSAVVDFLGLGARYKVCTEGPHYNDPATFGRLWTLQRGNLKINVIESRTWNPLDVILCFRLSCIYGYLSANGAWHAYADLTAGGTAMTSPAKFSFPDGVPGQSTIRTVTRKFTSRG
ncbi:hypothetical protein C8R47DRAFT_957655, partial [Mycena vitilis]